MWFPSTPAFDDLRTVLDADYRDGGAASADQEEPPLSQVSCVVLPWGMAFVSKHMELADVKKSCRAVFFEVAGQLLGADGMFQPPDDVPCNTLALDDTADDSADDAREDDQKWDERLDAAKTAYAGLAAQALSGLLFHRCREHNNPVPCHLFHFYFFIFMFVCTFHCWPFIFYFHKKE